MAYPTVGTEGNLVSWGSANIYSTLVTNMRTFSAVFNEGADVVETTGLNSTAASRLPGLKSSSVSLSAYGMTGAANAYPNLGNVGTFVYTGSPTHTHYSLHVQSYDVTIETAAVHDITELTAAPKFRSFRPDYCTVSGSMQCIADSSTKIENLPDPNDAALPILTLTYGTTATLAGTAVCNQLGATVRRGDKNIVNYSFHSDNATPWAAAGALSIFGALTFGVPTWSAGGAAIGAMVIATLTGSRTISLADSFWRRIRLRCAPGELVSVDIDVVGSGTVTMA